MKTVNIIGAGRLGLHIGLALSTHRLARINGICNQHLASAEKSLSQLPHGVACSSLQALPVADIYLITCPDDAISNVVKMLRNTACLSGRIVLHCSGSLDSSVLEPLRKAGAFTASLHPLKAFPYPLDQDIFKQCFCVIEGDTEACDKLKALFTALGAIFLDFDNHNKSLYHCAAVMASNYLVTLASVSQSLFKQSGLPLASARNAVIALMEQSLANLKRCEDFPAALTGPLQRGDSACISKHLEVLRGVPGLKALYQSAALATLEYCQLQNASHEQIHQILQTGLTEC